MALALRLVLHCILFRIMFSDASDIGYDNLIINFTQKWVKTSHAILFSSNSKELFKRIVALHQINQFVYPIDLNFSYKLNEVLNLRNHGKTSVILPCTSSAKKLLQEASEGRYINKTYQWLILGSGDYHQDSSILIDGLEYLGPNAQVTYVNRTQFEYNVWDIHSKGRHLNAPIEMYLIPPQITYEKVEYSQSIHLRGQFNGVTLRGATVIDKNNITSSVQIERILSRQTKDSGVAAFSKYHYEILKLLRDQFNFSVNFRNARGWAGRFENTSFRLGYLGIVQRNEADIGATGAFNRKNRFAEFDTIHQSWKFETAFLYRFTPDLESQSKSGNFLSPFNDQVWIYTLVTLITVDVMWRMSVLIKDHQKRCKEVINKTRKINKRDNSGDSSCVATNHDSLSAITLNLLAAICQQGIDPIPKGLATRTIILTTFCFSLVMYNYYTSSVVGGLLSSNPRGPASVGEIIFSPLKLSFEDIGYYKVLFRETKSPLIAQLITKKVVPVREPFYLPVYSDITSAIPFIKNGSFAFHCEIVDAFPIIATLFDMDEICDLRVVNGLMETEIMNWIVTKNSQYTELFRIASNRVREVGFVERLLRQRQPKKPVCQSLYTIYPVNWKGIMGAVVILCGGVVVSILSLIIENLVMTLNCIKINFNV